MSAADRRPKPRRYELDAADGASMRDATVAAARALAAAGARALATGHLDPLRAELPAPEQHDDIRVRWYRDLEQLDAALAAPEVVAWYSEFLYERRLTRNGKNVFSLREFAMGYGGALDSLEDLLRLANMSFYRNYSRYLGPAFSERGPR